MFVSPAFAVIVLVYSKSCSDIKNSILQCFDTVGWVILSVYLVCKMFCFHNSGKFTFGSRPNLELLEKSRLVKIKPQVVLMAELRVATLS